jgi:hypothetical protein
MVAPAPIKEKVREKVVEKQKIVQKVKTEMRPEQLPVPKGFMEKHTKISGDGGGDDDSGDSWDDFYSWTPPKSSDYKYGKDKGWYDYPYWPTAGKPAMPPEETKRDYISPDKSKMLPPPPPPGGDKKPDDAKSEKKDGKDKK